MHHQHIAGRQIRQQVFGAAAKPGDGLSGQALGEVLGERPAQIGAVKFDLGLSRPLHHGREPTPHGFDFG
jgi:hypothetical protein